jgi:hypothetical protein
MPPKRRRTTRAKAAPAELTAEQLQVSGWPVLTDLFL